MSGWRIGTLLIGLGVPCFLAVVNVDFLPRSSETLFQVMRSPSARKLESSMLEDDIPIISNKWIVVTTINKPTEDLKRFVLTGWNVVAVADKKTPLEWKLDGAHFLSVERQGKLGLQLPNSLPFGTYTRKNVGYLYAILKGAEWIYDTDDDNKPYGLGLDQFDYNNTVAGIRLQAIENSNLSSNVFNPYSYFGNPDMWPRGFPLEMISDHTNGEDRMLLCRKMKPAVVQQGLVHKDPDVDAVYRLLHADKKTGLNEQFDKFAPPVTLEEGTYSPWNSQNTLFHKKAFFTLFLPTNVEFRVTDIWRSFFSQKLLHLIGETIAFYPVNAIQIRSAHDYLADFQDEQAVYLKSGQIIETLNEWICSGNTTEGCVIELAELFSEKNFWKVDDVQLIRTWIEDLKRIGFRYVFPPLAPATEYLADEQKNANCVRSHIDFSQNTKVKTFEQKQKNLEELAEFCEKKGKISMNSSRLDKIEDNQKTDLGLFQKSNTALILTANWPWKSGIGILQRLYEPYFATVIFCGTWNEAIYNSKEIFPPVTQPFNYFHLSQEQIKGGYFIYYCLSRARDLKLQNLEGYYVVADDTAFNFWHTIKQDTMMHPVGIHPGTVQAGWWRGQYGKSAAKRFVDELVAKKYANNSQVQEVWKKLDELSWLNTSHSGNTTMRSYTPRSISDMYYIPSGKVDFVADIFELMHEAGLFLEHALGKVLQVVDHVTYRAQTKYLWYDGSRNYYDKFYNATMLMVHPIKIGSIAKNEATINQYCRSVVQTFVDQLGG